MTTIDFESLARSILMPKGVNMSENVKIILDDADYVIEQIMEAYVNDGMKESEIAKSFGLSELEVHAILESQGV